MSSRFEGAPLDVDISINCANPPELLPKINKEQPGHKSQGNTTISKTPNAVLESEEETAKAVGDANLAAVDGSA